VLAQAASQDNQIAGEITVEAAKINDETTGEILISAASSDSEIVGAILAGAAKHDSDATGETLAAAAAVDDSAVGEVLATAADIDKHATGEALAVAAALDPPGVGDALAAAALIDPEATGLALAAAAADDPEGTGEILAAASASEPEASGHVMAFSAEEDTAATGGALAVAVGFDPEAIGQAFVHALKLKAEAIAQAIEFAANDNAGGIQTALQTGPALDKEASEILARVLPSISWVPQQSPEPGRDPAGDGVVLNAVLVPGDDAHNLESSPVSQILVKFPENREEPVIRVQVVEDLPPDIPNIPGDRIVSDFLAITGENFTSEELVVAQVTLGVERSWLEANNIHEWSIEFTRFDEESGDWKPALANRIGDGGERILYSLVVSEFSLWALSGSTEPPPVIFKVDNLEVLPGNINQGDAAMVAATVNNILAEPAEYTAVLWVNGSMSASQTLQLEPNESRRVSFEISPEEGDYEVRIDRLSTSLSVLPEGGKSYLLWVYLGLPLLALFSLVIVIRRRRNRPQAAFH